MEGIDLKADMSSSEIWIREQRIIFFTGSTAPLGPGLCSSVSWSFYRR
jgi:hypothetical protein